MKILTESIKKTLLVYKPFYQSWRALSQQSVKNEYSDRDNNSNAKNIFAGSVAAGFLGYYVFDKQRRHALAKGIKEDISKTVGKYKKGLPCFSLKEISQHKSKDTKLWVTYKEGVYDITDFVDRHPGGDQIYMAAGSSLEPYWVIYAVHEADDIYELLETYRIGNLCKEDLVKVSMSSDIVDPYAKEPVHSPLLRPITMKPFNGECPVGSLVENFITHVDLLYVRNHLPVPEIDPATYKLKVEIEGTDQTVIFSLDELKKFPKRTITSTIMCAGNRRTDMLKVKSIKGVSWGPAAAGNMRWAGARLSDVLRQVGVKDCDNRKFEHVQFEGIDSDVMTGRTYGASIPIWKAMDRRCDVLIAYEVNGGPLPKDHGFPVRMIIPGIAGARNVKWLGKIIVSKNESQAHWQQNDYKGFSPSTDWDTVDFKKAPAVQELPVTSTICIPNEGDTVKVVDGHIVVKGYAWTGAGQRVIRVDVTGNGGKTWHVANFDHDDPKKPPYHWAWVLWSVRIPVEKDQKSVEVWSKAVDSCYNSQPDSVENIWNLRGICSNAYHRVKVDLSR